MTIRKRLTALVAALLLFATLLPVAPGEVQAVTVTQNQKNIVARANYFYGITWVAKQTVSGWGGTFYAGNTYRIPYGQPIYSGKYVGYQATFEEFIQAANTAGSLFYTGRSWYDGPTAPYYVSDCSAFVSWCWGIDRTTTYYIPNRSTGLGYVTVDRATRTLQLGDALNSSAHVVLVTDLSYDAAGNITSIEITEMTPPQMKRTRHSPSSLYNKYKQYTIQRYTGNVPTAPGQQTETWIEKACFDPMVYRDRNKDLAGMTDAQLKDHWLNHGIKEGRPSSTILDLQFYLNNNPDLKAAYGTDYAKVYNHFITSGYKEHRKSSALFDGTYYTQKYPDVVANYKELYLKHYVDNGIHEGRRGSLTFDPNYYWFIRPDVADAWPGDYEMCAKHYAGHGINAQIEAYDREFPVVSDVQIYDVSSAGYTVSCKVTDNWGVDKVAFPTWTVHNGQDDLADDFMNTQKGTKNGDTFTFRVNASDHNYEIGEYGTHIYAEDKGGNQTVIQLEVIQVEDQGFDPNPDPDPDPDPTPTPDPDPIPEQITPLASAQCVRNGDLITNVPHYTTVSSFLAQFENRSLEVLDQHGKELSGTAMVGTGATVNLYVGGLLADTVTVMILGDTDGNGCVDTTDYMRTKAAIMGNLQLGQFEQIAADVDQSGSINTTDYMRIKAYFLGNFNL